MIRAVAALAFSMLALSASAEVIDVTFTGTVSYADGTTANSGLVDGQMVTGAMQYVTTPAPRGRITYDELAGFRAPVAAPQLSGITPDLSVAQFKTGNFYAPEPLLDTNFYLSLSPSAPANYPMFASGSTLGSILLSQLGNLDLSGGEFASTAGYSSQDAGGQISNTRVIVRLTGIMASVPEPAPLALVGAAVTLLAAARRRRGRV